MPIVSAKQHILKLLLPLNFQKEFNPIALSTFSVLPNQKLQEAMYFHLRIKGNKIMFKNNFQELKSPRYLTAVKE